MYIPDAYAHCERMVTVMEFPGEKLFIKLWETLSEKAIGGWLRPGQQRREGLVGLELKRAELLTLAQAAREAGEIASGAKSLADFNLQLSFSLEKPLSKSKHPRVEPTVDVLELIEQSNGRANIDSVRKEINVAKAILHAEEKIFSEDHSEVSDEKVNDDWIFRWRDYAGDVNSDEMQRLWGRLLAGEVKSPGSYSLRCMDFLRNLEQSEAKLIQTLCELSIDGLILKNPDIKKYVCFNQILELETLGIISGASGGGILRTISVKEGDVWERVLVANDKCLLVAHTDSSATLQLSGYLLTVLGHQMHSLGSFKADAEYLKEVGQQLVSQGFSVKIADYRELNDNEFAYFNEVEVLL